VAFANTDGGILVIGLEDPQKAKEDNKRLIGISENLDNVSEFLKLIDKEIDPPLRLWNKFEVDIKNTKNEVDKLLVVSVGKANEVHSLKKGDTFVRKGRQNVKIGSSEIIRLKYEKGSIRFEDEGANIKTLDVLDEGLLKQYKKDTQSESESDWQFLKDNGLAVKIRDEFKLTKAGVLLFAKNPSVILKSKCGIKISHYYGKKPTYSGEPNFVRRPFTVEGPLLKQIEKTLEYFREVVKASPPKLSGSAFKPSLLIPEWAFQEAITNAVIHRNYFLQDDIQVRFFDDRIEVESPGTYPGHITVRNIRTERFSRNPIIQRTLNRFQSAPNLDIGEGVDRIFRIMQENNLYEPLFLPPDIRPNTVLLVLFNLQKIEYWDTINQYLSANYRITNNKAREITGVKDTLKMSRLLKGWVDKGLLEKVGGKSKKVTYYIKPGQNLPKDLFSRGYENKQ
jgi:ATP-dependent DNA helicase RecG